MGHAFVGQSTCMNHDEIISKYLYSKLWVRLQMCIHRINMESFFLNEISSVRVRYCSTAFEAGRRILVR
jgi:hypothetical protein